MNVPSILLSGNHKKIKSWRNDQKIRRTFERRKDLISLNDFKKLSGSKRINEEYDNFIRLNLGNEYNSYPDW
tara:strand:+ start:62 stop:277 length:216 start_codon:yes stop_codon:yes gene_type:complete